MSKKWEVGLSSCGKEINEDLFKAYKAAGIKYMEISLDANGVEDFDLKEAKRLADQYGVILWSYHLPFTHDSNSDISTLDEEVEKASVERQKRFIRLAGEVGIPYCIIHPSCEPLDILQRIDHMELCKKNLHILCDEAEKYGVTLCVEDLPRTCLGRNSFDMREILKSDKRLRSCFDTNHLMGEYIDEYIQHIGTNIVTLHVSDYDFRNEKHWLPGEGDINWQQLIAALEEVGYDGPFLYELGFHSDTIDRSRDLTCEDFARNADELFNNKPITVLGKRK